jgi:hypothetical protein
VLYQGENASGKTLTMKVLVVVFILLVAYWACGSIDTIVVSSEAAESMASRLS